MNMNTFLRGVIRRWYVVAGGLIVTIALAGIAYAHVGPTYQRTATEVLIPGTQSYPLHDNPYLYMGNLSQASDVLIGALGAEQVIDPIQKAYPGSSIQVTDDSSTSGPMITIQVTAPSNEAVAGALGRIVEQITPVLGQLQAKANVPPAAKIKAIPVTIDRTSQVSAKSRLEIVGIVGVAGIVLTLLIAALVDSLLLSLASRRSARQGDENREEEDGDEIQEVPVDGSGEPASEETAVGQTVAEGAGGEDTDAGSVTTEDAEIHQDTEDTPAESTELVSQDAD